MDRKVIRMGWEPSSALSMAVLLVFSGLAFGLAGSLVVRPVPPDQALGILVLAAAMEVAGLWVFPQSRRGSMDARGFLPPSMAGSVFLSRGFRGHISWDEVRLFAVDLNDAGVPRRVRVFTSPRRCYSFSLFRKVAREDDFARTVLEAWRGKGRPVFERTPGSIELRDRSVWLEAEQTGMIEGKGRA